VLGFILWYLFGRGSEGRPVSAARPRGQVAPDDDEDYLRQVDREVQLGKHAPQASDDDEPSSSTDAYEDSDEDSDSSADSDARCTTTAGHARSSCSSQCPTLALPFLLAAIVTAPAALTCLITNQSSAVFDRLLSS